MNKKQLLELASCCLWILALGLSAGISLFGDVIPGASSILGGRHEQDVYHSSGSCGAC